MEPIRCPSTSRCSRPAKSFAGRSARARGAGPCRPGSEPAPQIRAGREVTRTGPRDCGPRRPALDAVVRNARHPEDGARTGRGDGWRDRDRPHRRVDRRRRTVDDAACRADGSFRALVVLHGPALRGPASGAWPFRRPSRFRDPFHGRGRACGRRLVHVEGAPERVLRMCAGIDAAHRHERAEALARRGLRVLALAGRSWDGDRIDPAALEGTPTVFQWAVWATSEGLNMVPVLSMAHATLRRRSATERSARPWP